MCTGIRFLPDSVQNSLDAIFLLKDFVDNIISESVRPELCTKQLRSTNVLLYLILCSAHIIIDTNMRNTPI